ncbi:MAG: hypothetical protein IPJ74_23145 [Saprospiraceae bacterium]|nr:hypothetical protein [Saprospiraceae bacterium]
MKIIGYLIVFAALITGCSTQTTECGCLPSGEEVEFYLLKSYDTVPDTYFTIINAKIENESFVRFSEIEEYDHKTYQFTLKKIAIGRIKPILEPEAFAVTVDRQIVYTGFFRQSFLSSSCDCIRIDPQSGLLNSNKIWVELGYAPTRDLSDIDKRNDTVLLATLAKAGKLR